MSLTLARWSAKTGTRRRKQDRGAKLTYTTALPCEPPLLRYNTLGNHGLRRSPDSRGNSHPRLRAAGPAAHVPFLSRLLVWYMGTNYVVHPDASFQLGYRGQWRPYFLEYERRATTPKRVPAKLESYRRYLQSGWAHHFVR